MINKKILAYIKLIAVIVVWAGVYHVAKYLVDSTDAFTLGFLRFLMATIVLLAMYFAKHGVKRSFTRPDSHWIMLWLIGLIGVFGYQVFFFGAESIISANEVAIFFAFSPCITVVLGRLVLKQKIFPLAYVGIVIALLGTIGVITMSHKTEYTYSCLINAHPKHWGDFLAILTAVAMAAYNVLNKKASRLGMDALTITTFSSLIGTLFLFITFLLFGGKVIDLLHKPLMFWVALTYIAILATVIAYKWYSDAICELGVGKTAVFLNGIPLCAVLIGVLLLGNTISTDIILSGVVIIIGVVMTNLTTFRK
jgi:drug/metabolite transporter (DMT)-like permease